ncbi:MAG TPA: hypothetical protein VLB79_02210 [Solirubrobacterales bacterium]|nr:hypothetical protein [Solirubrobacterales bacterium]
MSSNRERQERGAIHRARAKTDQEMGLETRRAEMHAAEGHAGSIPRGNQQPEREILGSHRIEWDRVLGH